MMKRKWHSGAVVAALLASGFAAHAGSTTSIQDNGVACLADSRNPQASMWRNGDGFSNSSSDSIGVYCPLSRASGDSYTPGSGTVNFLNIYYTGPAPTSCTIKNRSNNGSVYTSPTFVTGTDAGWGSNAAVVKLPSAYTLGDGLGAIGVSCTLPSGSTIIGFIHNDYVPDVSGGT